MAALTATINYPDNKAADLRDTLAVAFGYQETVDDGIGNQIPNPQSKVNFIQQKADVFFTEWIKNTYRSEKQRIANQSISEL